MAAPAAFPPVPSSLVAPLAIAEAGRVAVGHGTPRVLKSDLGQFWTPWQTAGLIAGLAGDWGDTVRILDPGAGAGALTAAWVERVLASRKRPSQVHFTLYEIDPDVTPYLAATMTACLARLEEVGVKATCETRMTDFVGEATERLERGLFSGPDEHFDLVLMNPPYKKLSSSSTTRRRLAGIGIEATNLYAAFVALSVRMLRPEGRLVAITPRSFCNGPYFRSFRLELLDTLDLTDVHLFDSRAAAFRDDSVLQENIIISGRKGHTQSPHVTVALAKGPADQAPVVRKVPFTEMIRPGDPDQFVHLPVGPSAEGSADAVHRQPCRLAELGVTVSTGRVVDFRLREDWAEYSAQDTVPLLYAGHFVGGMLVWPKVNSKKPNALRLTPRSRPWLVRNGPYVLVKRFSSKEERRRVVAYLLSAEELHDDLIGIENHLNYFHSDGGPLELELAAGLTCYLNSPTIDRYFRSFNGHTQVNATDLRSLRFPSREALVVVGRRWLERGRPFGESEDLGEEFFENGN